MSGRLPDESTLLIPEAWREEMHPRRGGLPPVPEAVLDPSAREGVRERLEAALPAIEKALGSRQGWAQRFVEAARAYLRGDADPLGAAVVAKLEVCVRKELSHQPWIDAWIAEHGLAFAACACAEADQVLVRDAPNGQSYVIRDGDLEYGDAYWAVGSAGRRMRALLAVADESDYAEAVERLAEFRRNSTQKAVVSYLVPTRQDWVDECLAECDLSLHVRRLLWCSITSTEQAKRLGYLGVYEPYQPEFDFLPGMLATVVEGVGPAIASRVARALDEESDVRIRKSFLDVLSALPTEGAFRMVADRLDRGDVRPALVAMMERFPRRALRMLASRADGDSKRLVLSLLDEHLRAWPELDAEELPAHVRSTLEEMRGRKVEEAAAGDLPKALVSGRSEPPPVWAAPAMLPQLLLRGRARAVPAEATWRLFAALAKTGPRRAPAANFRTALEACDPGSLAAFGWALFDRWRSSGEVAAKGWPLSQLRWTGDDETARRIGAMVRSATWSDGTKLPLNALDVLAAMGSEVAMMQLHAVAEKAKAKSIKKKARRLLDQVAQERGLTPDQLADRLVPDFGLDAEGSMTLDYGPRRFTVGFDEQLRPTVIDEQGKARKSLPKPGVKDDAELAPAAHQRFGGLKKDVRALAGDQIRRMERAMTERRRWEPADFRELLVGHPLLWHIVRRLVWVHEDGVKRTAFRVAEDRTLADVNDDVLTLPEAGLVGIAHPVHLGEDLAGWAETFADYEIMQPFSQLGRPVLAFTAQERAEAELARFKGLDSSLGKVLGLERRGWVRAAAEDGGVQYALNRELPEGRTVVVEISPGIYVWGPGQSEEHQKLTAVRISGSSHARFGDLDAVTASELLLILNELVEPAE
ncbi:hypothetical protein GCM10010191_30030 [Actinomadura vinacea]|uniref:DUF4132 domain-containing protein n=1 Tax=Actinomadura vinacea TaxID=115336 RepID=A0ABP5W1I8_9ACTN